MSRCRRCGGDYGPLEAVTVPLRALPTVQVSGIEGQRCQSCGDLKFRVPNMEELFRVVAVLLVHKPARLSGPEARFLREYPGQGRRWASAAEDGEGRIDLGQGCVA